MLGLVGASCLDRPVTNASPTTQTNFVAVVHNEAVDKVDLLFMIDNSASMGDKQELLSEAVPNMITRLVQPNCLDANGNPIPGVTAATDGTCTSGKAEFPPVHDMHIAIVTSSLGGRGGDVCPDNATNPADPSLSAHNNDNGELVNRTAPDDAPSTDAQPDNFLSWFPSVPSNSTHPMPPTPAIASVTQLVSDFTAMVGGVNEHGCGFEGMDEAWYRFLVQPDPYATISVTNQKASYQGIDNTVLAQRAAFLRPDSLVAVIVVTDENQEISDPLTIAGQGWAFMNQTFPGSPNGSAPEASIECSQQDPNNLETTGPNDPNCTSCAFIQSDPNFATRCPPDPPTGTKGYLDPSDDMLNVRFFQQQRRFGLNAGYTSPRYVRGLQKTTVPDSLHEHDGNGSYIGETNANCVNPLFAQNLPTTGMAPGDPSLCNLTAGSRTADLVYFAAITGVPHQLLQSTPGDGTCPSGTDAADCPQKDTLTPADWTKITGNNPEKYDFTGADFHMLESEVPRTAGGGAPGMAQAAGTSSCPPSSADNCDPINGREWTTNKDDLEFACIFQLQTPKDCSQPQYLDSCDCATGSNSSNTPLCQKDATGAYTQTQIYAKAYPGIEHLAIAHAMSDSPVGNQGIVSSLCPIHVEPATGLTTLTDPLFGYNPAVNAIIDRLKASLNNTCLPQKLTADTSGNVPCLILVQSSTQVGAGACANPGSACDPTKGLLGPGVVAPGATQPTLTQDILTKFCRSQEAAYPGMPGAMGDPDTYPTCALQQLTTGLNPGDFQNQSCASSKDPGWCYVTGAAANGCPQAILFSSGEPPTGSTVSLQCIEQAVTVLEGGTASEGDGGGGGD
jgi:hypothetical protein